MALYKAAAFKKPRDLPVDSGWQHACSFLSRVSHLGAETAQFLLAHLGVGCIPGILWVVDRNGAGHPIQDSPIEAEEKDPLHPKKC